MALPKKIEGIPVGFDVMRTGKTLIKLNDGFYIEVTCVPMKVLKMPQTDAEGNPQYAVAVATPQVVWSKDQIGQMKDKETTL